MKKTSLILTAVLSLLLFCPKGYAASNTNCLAFLPSKDILTPPTQSSAVNSCDEIRKALYKHLRYANNYDLDGLKSLYSHNYVTSDGLNSDIYFELVKKTWDSYPDIKYRITIQNISVGQNTAFAEVREDAIATTDSKSGIINEKGLLESSSNCVYYFEKINNEWLITSDHIVSEKTALRYGSAKGMKIALNAPCQIPADSEYTVGLNMETPKDSLIIASVGQEKITYPQIAAEEVFRKLPDYGVLERVFKSNNKSLNEYAVASFGVTKAEIKNGTEIKIYVTGLGFIMSRVNVIPKNDFIKVAKNEKDK